MCVLRGLTIAGLILAATVGLWGQGSLASGGVVTGRVFCSDMHTPCRFASVSLESEPAEGAGERQARVYGATTDVEGNFEISGVSAGTYLIAARLPGYISNYDALRVEYGLDRDLPPALLRKSLERISVAAEKTVSTSLTLQRGASVGGTVRYDDGAPAISFPVDVLRKSGTGEWKSYVGFVAGVSRSIFAQGSGTDDHGRFYVSGLPPGEYKVMVTMPDTSMRMEGITGKPTLRMTETPGKALRLYNGGAFRLGEAEPIALREGEERSDIEITVPTLSLRSVRGVVTRSADQLPVVGSTVSLLDPDDKTVLVKTETHENGGFEIELVRDGTYVVEVEAPGQSGLRSFLGTLVVSGNMLDLNYALKSR